MSVRAAIAAFTLILLIPATGGAQVRPRTVELKSQEEARTYALYAPGGGYIYTGEYGRAALALGVTVASAYKIIDIATCNLTNETTLGGTPACDGNAKYFWLVAMVAPYVYGIFDAPVSADRANAALKGLTATIDVDRNGRLQVGLRKSFR